MSVSLLHSLCAIDDCFTTSKNPTHRNRPGSPLAPRRPSDHMEAADHCVRKMRRTQTVQPALSTAPKSKRTVYNNPIRQPAGPYKGIGRLPDSDLSSTRWPGIERLLARPSAPPPRDEPRALRPSSYPRPATLPT